MSNGAQKWHSGPLMHLRLVIASVILLSGCVARQPLPSDVVLENSVKANQKLASAEFTFDASFDSNEAVFVGLTRGTMNAAGIIQNGGRQLQAEVSIKPEENQSPIDFTIIKADEDETYLKFKATGDEDQSVNILKDRWFVLPTGAAGSTLTPDPEFLRALSAIVTITRDQGIGSINGYAAYEYDVALDAEKLRQFFVVSGNSANEAQGMIDELKNMNITGKMWIDADTFVLRRLQWMLASEDANAPLTGEMIIEIEDDISGARISPPADALSLPVNPLLQLQR